MPSLLTYSPEDTAELGRKLGGLLLAGDVIGLNGELGTGKTKFAQGVALGLGVDSRVKSPSFTLVNEYYGRLPFYHLDVYRLNDPFELEDLGYEEYFYGDGVTLVEWADQVLELLPGDRLDIYIDRLAEDENRRKIKLAPRGERYRRLVEELMDVVCAGN
ncbi:MAG: tRNA threonylcarbamoyladenosine biosynthesis protein TsaE [Firmicutes bacterium ADurb.Bin456]|nr:MAG: tRNA threonylcarbamoyladenosine biosynthesis protein TsaE [Firmicutes bacterium ADurb.Bin456]